MLTMKEYNTAKDEAVKRLQSYKLSGQEVMEIGAKLKLTYQSVYSYLAGTGTNLNTMIRIIEAVEKMKSRHGY